MRAGSMPSFFAAIGRSPPITFANITTSSIARLTVNAMSAGSPSIIIIFAKLKIESKRPTVTAILSSFQSTFAASAGSMSPTAIPRMISVAAWLPVFPPVPMRSGKYDTSTITDESMSSNWAIIAPVTMSDTERNMSQGILVFTWERTLMSRYSVSVSSRIPAIRSKSSVFSSSITSMISSTVIMPTSLSSLSTTGIARKSYFLNTSETSSWSSYTLTLTKSSSMISPTIKLSSAITRARRDMIPINFLPCSFT